MNLGKYELDNIYCGDSAFMLRSLPDGCIDLTVTSPPYDNLRTYNGFTFYFEAIAKELYRVTKPGGVVVWVVADQTINGSETGTSFRQALYFMECGFNLHDTMIYQSDKPPLTHNRYEQAFEYMFVLCKGKPATFNGLKESSKHAGKLATSRTFRHDGNELNLLHSQGRIAPDKLLSNIWQYKTGGVKIDHPAIFPEALARDHIISWSNPGDIVLDPFCGSGTTLKMAKVLHRHYIGMDISKEYVELSQKRVMFTPDPLPLFVESDKVTVEQIGLI